MLELLTRARRDGAAPAASDDAVAAGLAQRNAALAQEVGALRERAEAAREELALLSAASAR
jgi:hypothetical protein